jgi:hypothetical protein
MKNVPVPTVRRRATDAEIRWAIKTDPECAKLYQEALELARAYCRPKPEPEVLVKVVGPAAVKARANPGGAFFGVRDADGGPTVFESRRVTVLVDNVPGLVDAGRCIQPQARPMPITQSML